MKSNFLFWIFVSTILLFACAPITQKNTLVQEPNKTKYAGVGDVIIKITKSKPLKNAFGNADIFGRTTDAGYIELRFAGVEETGEIVLFRKDIDIISNETTMSRSGLSITSSNSNTSATGNYYGTNSTGQINVNANTQTQSVMVQPTQEYHIAVPSGSFAIRLRPGETMLPFAGHLLEIIHAERYSLKYRIRKQ